MSKLTLHKYIEKEEVSYQSRPDNQVTVTIVLNSNTTNYYDSKLKHFYRLYSENLLRSYKIKITDKISFKHDVELIFSFNIDESWFITKVNLTYCGID